MWGWYNSSGSARFNSTAEDWAPPEHRARILVMPLVACGLLALFIAGAAVGGL